MPLSMVNARPGRVDRLAGGHLGRGRGSGGQAPGEGTHWAAAEPGGVRGGS